MPAADSQPMTRRRFVQTATAAAATAFAASSPKLADAADAATSATHSDFPYPFLTPAESFRDVSRGNPKPFTLTGSALVNARLTPDTWRLEITADTTRSDVVKEPAGIGTPLTIAGGNALDLAGLERLGQKHGVKFLKAMQCLNIPAPLGQGLWEGVPLRDVLGLCGSMRNVRRIYYWGFHNNDPKQLFQSSLSYTQAMETAPDDLPAFIAYRLNGKPIPLIRGGPMRMIIPWAHGFKSIKWLQAIVLTNDHRANDTYAEQNNDPESHLKTAAYLDELPESVPARKPVFVKGLAISGLSGLKRVEYSLKSAESRSDLEVWRPCQLANPPSNWSRLLPEDVSPKELLGFDRKTGKPKSWPVRYTMVSWSATLKGLEPGNYELRARAVDLNDFPQPEPRSNQKAGKNAVEVRQFKVVA